MDEKLIGEIKKNMEEKEAHELQQIWEANDRNEYSDEAFEAIRQLLEEQGKNPNAIPQHHPPENEHADHKETFKKENFFSFRTMVSRSIIQIIYILGAAGLSIYGLILIVNSTQGKGTGGLAVTGLGILLLGNLVWRILCEAWILLFNIHDVLVSIEKKL